MSAASDRPPIACSARVGRRSMIVIILALLIHGVCIRYADRLTRMFIIILFCTHLYFCGGGYFYWVYVKEGYFGGMNWPLDALVRSLMVVSLSSVSVAVIVTAYNRRLAHFPTEFDKPIWTNSLLTKYLIPASFGLIGCMAIISSGLNNFETSSNPLILVAYQFSDMLIPCVLFAMTGGQWGRRFAISLGLFFVIYAIMVGFRYKLALLFGPIVFWYNLTTGPGSKSFFKRLTTTGFLGLGGVLLFTFMTLFRVKFGAPDLSKEVSLDDTAYGFFAEANIVFAMTAIMRRLVDAGVCFYLDPIIDSVMELIPHALYAERTSGLYLLQVAAGFITDEGANSGTAYPYVGEFAIMGGYVGIIVGTIIYAFVYIYFHNLLLRRIPNVSVAIMGIALLATLMGYYHYSRGYLPQANKAYLFVLAPYLFLAFGLRRSANTRGKRLKSGTPAFNSNRPMFPE